jgi:predicted house-cleaning noncanonical NTP pyrophosphatase (MazG superfamily)
MRHNKLVRDRIPKIIEQNNSKTVTHIADDEEYYEKLKEKLREETEEFLREDNKEELADILEVLYTIISHKKIDKEEIEELRQKKNKERGSFTKKIILDETS